MTPRPDPRRVVRQATGLAALALLCATASAQTVTSTLHGLILDPANQPLPDATVRIRQISTGATRSLVSDEKGLVVVPGLAPDRYEVTAERSGFQTARTETDLAVGQTLRLELRLPIGASRTVVEVDASPGLVETDSATVSGLIDSRRVVDLPLNGRNFAQLIPLQPGVAVISSQGLLGGGPDAAGIQGSGQYVNGARSSVNSFLIDGADANDPVVPSGTGAASTAIFTGSSPGINAVSVDAVREFRVLTSGATAEFGRSSGATVNLITKSGTNQWHGSAFSFLRNRALNARNTFEAQRPGFTQNNFGGTIGGALKKDRTFVFGSYEGFRQRQQVSVTNLVPSANTIAAVRRQSPLLGAVMAAYYPSTSVADLPVDEILTRGSPVLGTVVVPRGNGIDQDAVLVKLDHRFSGRHSASGRYQIFEAAGLPGTVSGTGIAGSNIGFTNRAQNVVLSDLIIISPAVLAEGRIAFQRNSPRSTFEATPQALLDAGRLRTTGPFAGQPYGAPDTVNGVPTISAVGFGIAPLGYETTAPNARGVNTYQASYSLSAVRGDHTLKAGGEVRRVQENSLFSFRLRPEITYQSGGSSTILQPGAPSFSYDQNIFLTPSTSMRGFRMTEWAAFVQDSWRATSRLTIEAGLRYEYFGRPSEVNGYLNNGFLTSGNQVNAAANILSLGHVALNTLRMRPVGPGREFSMFQPDRNNFAPRVGLAWRPSRLTGAVVRAAYGIFYDRIFNNVFGNARNSAPYTLLVTLANAPFGALPAADAFTTPLPIGPVTVNPDIRSPYTQRYNFSIAREFRGHTMAEIAYVGARGLRLMRTLRPNQGANFDPDFRPANIDPPARSVTFEDYRPIRYGNVSTRDSSGASTYHSLQARLERRFTSRLSVQANYTYGRAVDIASGEILTDVVVTTFTNKFPVRSPEGRIPAPSLGTMRQIQPFATVTEAARFYNANFVGPNQFRADIGNAAFDVQHVFVANGSYALPGYTRRWLGGWQLNGMFRHQSGVPLNLVTGIDVNGDGNGPDRASLRSGALDSILSGDGSREFFRPSTLAAGRRIFDNGAILGISATPEDVSSYLKRNRLHGPSMTVADFSVLKDFPVREQVRLQFRAEFFNLLNLTNLANPIANMSSPSFGQILATSTPPRQIQFGLRLGF